VALTRSIACLAALVCAGTLVACRSETREGGAPAATASSGAASPGTPAVPVSPVIPTRSPSPTTAACPSPARLIAAMDARGWTDFRVEGRVVCDGTWATAHVRVTSVASDPARALFRSTGGRLRALTYGTDGLCDAPGVPSPPPPKIRRALGPYC
jgi:hypothetical protein